MNRVGPSGQPGSKIKPAAWPFLKRAWVGLGPLGLGSGFSSLGRAGPKAGRGLFGDP